MDKAPHKLWRKIGLQKKYLQGTSYSDQQVRTENSCVQQQHQQLVQHTRTNKIHQPQLILQNLSKSIHQQSPHISYLQNLNNNNNSNSQNTLIDQLNFSMLQSKFQSYIGKDKEDTQNMGNIKQKLGENVINNKKKSYRLNNDCLDQQQRHEQVVVVNSFETFNNQYDSKQLRIDYRLRVNSQVLYNTNNKLQSQQQSNFMDHHYKQQCSCIHETNTKKMIIYENNNNNNNKLFNRRSRFYIKNNFNRNGIRNNNRNNNIVNKCNNILLPDSNPNNNSSKQQQQSNYLSSRYQYNRIKYIEIIQCDQMVSISQQQYQRLKDIQQLEQLLVKENIPDIHSLVMVLKQEYAYFKQQLLQQLNKFNTDFIEYISLTVQQKMQQYTYEIGYLYKQNSQLLIKLHQQQQLIKEQYQKFNMFKNEIEQFKSTKSIREKQQQQKSEMKNEMIIIKQQQNQINKLYQKLQEVQQLQSVNLQLKKQIVQLQQTITNYKQQQTTYQQQITHYEYQLQLNKQSLTQLQHKHQRQTQTLHLKLQNQYNSKLNIKTNQLLQLIEKNNQKYQLVIEKVFNLLNVKDMEKVIQCIKWDNDYSVVVGLLERVRLEKIGRGVGRVEQHIQRVSKQKLINKVCYKDSNKIINNSSDLLQQTDSPTKIMRNTGYFGDSNNNNNKINLQVKLQDMVKKYSTQRIQANQQFMEYKQKRPNKMINNNNKKLNNNRIKTQTSAERERQLRQRQRYNNSPQQQQYQHNKMKPSYSTYFYKNNNNPNSYNNYNKHEYQSDYINLLQNNHNSNRKRLSSEMVYQINSSSRSKSRQDLLTKGFNKKSYDHQVSSIHDGDGSSYYFGNNVGQNIFNKLNNNNNRHSHSVVNLSVDCNDPNDNIYNNNNNNNNPHHLPNSSRNNSITRHSRNSSPYFLHQKSKSKSNQKNVSNPYQQQKSIQNPQNKNKKKQSFQTIIQRVKHKIVAKTTADNNHPLVMSGQNKNNTINTINYTQQQQQHPYQSQSFFSKKKQLNNNNNNNNNNKTYTFATRLSGEKSVSPASQSQSKSNNKNTYMNINHLTNYSNHHHITPRQSITPYVIKTPATNTVSKNHTTNLANFNTNQNLTPTKLKSTIKYQHLKTLPSSIQSSPSPYLKNKLINSNQTFSSISPRQSFNHYKKY